jgi:hypothetical protein
MPDFCFTKLDSFIGLAFIGAGKQGSIELALSSVSRSIASVAPLQHVSLSLTVQSLMHLPGIQLCLAGYNYYRLLSPGNAVRLGIQERCHLWIRIALVESVAWSL